MFCPIIYERIVKKRRLIYYSSHYLITNISDFISDSLNTIHEIEGTKSPKKEIYWMAGPY